MITTLIVDEKFKDAWNNYVQSNSDSIAWQTWEWSATIQACYRNSTFIPIVAFEHETIKGILPFYLWDSGKQRIGISVPHAVAGGMVADNDEAKAALLMHAEKLVMEHSLSRLVLKQYKIKIDGDLSVDAHYHNRELELCPDTADLLKKITPVNQKKIGEADKLHLDFVDAATDITTFYLLLQKYHRAQGIPCASEKWIESLLNFGMYSIALAKKDGKIIAATMVKGFKKTVSFPYSCTVTNNRDSETAMYGLYWRLITTYAKKGFAIFHSGRMPDTEEAPSFRKGWGGTKYPYYYQYYPKTTSVTEFASKRGWKRKLFTSVWRFLPLTITKSLGQKIVERFP